MNGGKPSRLAQPNKGVQRQVQPARPVQTRRDASASSSGSEGEGNGSSDDEDNDETDDAALQKAMFDRLMAHSRAALGLDEPENGESSEQGRMRLSSEGCVSEDESQGSEDEDEDDESGEDDKEAPELDDGWTGIEQPRETRVVPEVVFDERAMRSSETATMSKAERRAFLVRVTHRRPAQVADEMQNGDSAKLMGLAREDPGAVSGKRKRKGADGDDDEAEDDRSNLSLDKTLHSMLLNNLLSSNAAAQASRPVEKRNAVSSRLLELAEYSLPGEGSKTVDAGRHAKHPAKIRAGIMKAQAKREGKARQEAEAAGSFVRGLGGLADGGKKRERPQGGRDERASLGELKKKKGMDGTKGLPSRDRGLSNGFGKFEGGMLKLSERDIARGSNVGGSRRGGRGGGRGGKRGRS